MGKKVRIDLKAGVGADPERPTLSKKKTDSVFWRNKTDRGHTILFGTWPFVEPWQPIQVPAKSDSPEFTVYAGISNGDYSYSIEPSINPSSGPPGDPSVLIGD